MINEHDDLAFIMGEVYGYLRDNRHLLPKDKYKAQPMNGWNQMRLTFRFGLQKIIWVWLNINVPS